MLKTVVLLNIFMKNVIYFVFRNSFMHRTFKRTAFIWNKNVFTVTFDQFNASLL